MPLKNWDYLTSSSQNKSLNHLQKRFQSVRIILGLLLVSRQNLNFIASLAQAILYYGVEGFYFGSLSTVVGR